MRCFGLQHECGSRPVITIQSPWDWWGSVSPVQPFQKISYDLLTLCVDCLHMGGTPLNNVLFLFPNSLNVQSTDWALSEGEFCLSHWWWVHPSIIMLKMWMVTFASPWLMVMTLCSSVMDVTLISWTLIVRHHLFQSWASIERMLMWPSPTSIWLVPPPVITDTSQVLHWRIMILILKTGAQSFTMKVVGLWCVLSTPTHSLTHNMRSNVITSKAQVRSGSSWRLRPNI